MELSSEIFNYIFEDELEVLERWSALSKEQAGGARRRPDLKLLLSEELSEKEGFYPPSFWCSALKMIRPETIRIGGGDSHDISCPPSSPLPSLREEPGRQEEESISRSDSSCESIISDTDLPDELDLERFQVVQPCTVGLPHSCEEYWSTQTEEELRQLLEWEDQCYVQLQGEDLRPDIERDEEGTFQIPFACSLLREIRSTSDTDSA